MNEEEVPRATCRKTGLLDRVEHHTQDIMQIAVGRKRNTVRKIGKEHAKHTFIVGE